VYSGNPNVPSEWSAVSEGIPGNDVRGILSFKYGTLNSGDTLKQSYAITYARSGNSLENVNALLNISEDVQLFYDTQSNVACNGATWGTSDIEMRAFEVFPNPSSGIVHIANEEGLELTVRVYNGMGLLVKEISSTHNSNIVLDLSREARGMYTVQFLTEKGVQTQKLVLD